MLLWLERYNADDNDDDGDDDGLQTKHAAGGQVVMCFLSHLKVQISKVATAAANVAWLDTF